MLILGIETSCDETAASVIQISDGRILTRSNIISSQIHLHAKWGGVVPNLAAREHLKNILPVIDSSLRATQVSLSDIDLIAVTSGPGLIPALLIGTNVAKTLAYVSKKPIIGIHHIEGHIYANFIKNEIGVSSKSQASNPKQIQNSNIKFPILCLVVSGGHTQLVLMKKHLNYKVVGQTLDDAAGEAFDKVARILGLGYPGGPIIAETAMNFKVQSSKFKVSFPRPIINSKNFDFSFSGLKTAVLYETKKHPELIKDKTYISALCHEFQQAVIDVLVHKTIRAAKKYRPKTIMIAGGVSANIELRYQLDCAIMEELEDTTFQAPDINYSLDNAAMIAAAGYYRWQIEKAKRKLFLWKNISAKANLKLK